MSKPLASTVVAGLVGRHVINWTDAVVEHNKNFALKDDYVTRNASFADLLSHRSGLKTGSGDLLEDLGFDRAYILGHLNQEPLDAFRSSYNYSNFGFTEGGQAAADAMKMTWEDLADEVLFRKLGMSASSYRHSDYARADKQSHPACAAREQRVGSRNTGATPIPRLRPGARVHRAGPGPMAPAAARKTAATRASPLLIRRPSKQPTFPMRSPGRHRPRLPDPASMGWAGTSPTTIRPASKLGHSGAFNLGAATAVSMLPGEQLAIVALTNGRPQGIPEAIAAGFLDTAQHGSPTVDWLAFTAGVFKQIDESEKPEVDYTKAPSDPAPAKANSAYTGTYDNSYYGRLWSLTRAANWP